MIWLSVKRDLCMETFRESTSQRSASALGRSAGRLPTLLGLLALCFCAPALAGPPYVADDPEPTDEGHYEVYLYASGEHADAGNAGAAGIDFNYGAAPDLQLTAVLPFAYELARGERGRSGVGNVELAAKYRFLHQARIGWDVSFFPRVVLPSASTRIGEAHASVLLPLWLERDWDRWSTFGGGGCAINPGRDARDYCLIAWALTRQLAPGLRLGAEVEHQTPDRRDGRATTGLGIGIQYDAGEHAHLLGYYAPSLQHPAETVRYSYYAGLLLTY